VAGPSSPPSSGQATGFVCQDPELPFPDFLPRPWEEEVDWHLLHHALARLDRTARLQTLEVLRSQGQWEPLLASTDDTFVRLVQGWLPEWPIDSPLSERLDWPEDRERQRQLDVLLDACGLMDREGRLAAALLELLRELAAWPAPAAEVTVPQSALSLEQVEQACEALVWMPAADYLRVVLHLDLQLGDDDYVTVGAARIISTVAARSRDFAPTGEIVPGHSGVTLLEGLFERSR